VPDIGKLLWPRSVAVIGASSDTKGLRGRILQILRGHPFAGPVYPVSRSEAEVQGLKAYRSVAELPEPVDLAVLIIPAKFVPDELARCGAAGIPAAIIPSSGFAEEAGEAGARLQEEIRAIAVCYDMAVNGPNGEGFANTEAALCPTFSPAMEAGATPLLPFGRTGQAAVIAQSGGLGFAFFDRGRPKDLSFRYIVTTGNEACLETFDFVDYMLDEGKTDVFLLLIEDVRNFETFERVAAKALKAGKPLIVSKLGQSEAGRRAVASHTGARAGRHDDYRAAFARYGMIESDDIDEMIDIAAGFLAFGTRLPAGNRVGICTSSGGGGAWVADVCAAAGLDVPELDAATRAAIDVHLPAYGTSQNPVDVTAQAVHQMGYAEFARLVAGSPAVDGVIVVVTGRSTRLLMGDREALSLLARNTTKPIFMWSYTIPAEECVRLFSETGYPLFTSARNCARTMRAMAEYQAAREQFSRGS
jgi:acetate---CoA ligase (ADP-forming)